MVNTPTSEIVVLVVLMALSMAVSADEIFDALPLAPVTSRLSTPNMAASKAIVEKDVRVPVPLGLVKKPSEGNEQLPPGSLGFVNMAGFALIAPTTVLAAPLGARLAHALSRRKLSLLFGLFLLIVASRMLLQSLKM